MTNNYLREIILGEQVELQLLLFGDIDLSFTIIYIQLTK